MSSFRLSLRRFVAQRGHCSHYYSDRGTNFVCASNQDALVDLADMVDRLDVDDCNWHFNTPNASHHGGAWERKIGAVRRILDETLQGLREKLLTVEEFSTLLMEAMAIVNNTPLWGVSSDPNDPSPLTPAMILTLRDVPNPPQPHQFEQRDLMALSLIHI